MELFRPPQAVVALAEFVRARLSEVSETIAPLWRVRESEILPAVDGAVVAARHLAGVIVGAAAPFAPTSYSRARLVRQMHASGLLTADEVRTTAALLELADSADSTPVGAATHGVPHRG